MKRNRNFSSRLVLLAFLLLAGSACQQSRVFEITTVRFEQGLENCLPKEGNCAFLSLAYPRLGGGVPQGREVLNAEILRFALQQENGAEAKDAKMAAETLFADFTQFKQENPKSPQVWWEKRQVEVLANDPKVFSLAFVNAGSLGGAHPIETKTLQSFDPKSGRAFQLSDCLKPGYEKVLTAIGETLFRQARKIPPNTDLNDAGFIFDMGFQLNENFAAGPSGLVFYYNPYEIASYADGPTELTIPYSLFKELIIEGGPLSSLAKL